ncbi:PLP-dependent aminotransferase family protein [Fervidicoccus fontis]|uniref:Multiple substrate aminotransferase n=1 Tax=Fervidicoccus fontis (strain DSM 19380 / JCM 18336 / VKM B-2539 / Kam940) TaxID=1163730 RepID=I0A1R6_FERFK|nr:PLP-dependent aminotransferase family protein [Fervidicoccus fontis]AFH42923.1 multiple substrate aminotransferase [Fervidicoccus fontis Kam940]
MKERSIEKTEALSLKHEKFFSKKALEMKASETRELLKLVENSNVISLAGGMPAPETFPVDIIGEITQEVIKNHAAQALQYGTTNGFTPLRNAIVEWMKKKYSIQISKDNLIITTGSQQALDLIGRVFINPGDVVIAEAPTYLSALQAFEYYKPEFVQIPLDDEGIRIDLLEEKLKELKSQGKSVKFVYTISIFQNPAGVTMSEKRRKEILELASQYDFIIIEDNPYGELRYSGSPIRPIKSWDDDGRVLYLGTLSKVLAPGFRIGWIAGDPRFINKLEIAKQSVDLCTSTFNQVIAWKYIEGGYLDKQIPKIVEFYKPRRDAMLKALEDFMPEGVKWTKPEGGMFIWVTAPEGIDTKLMFEKAVAKGVAYVPGEAFYAHREVKNAMRLNFTYVSEEKIREGISRLAETIKEEIKKSKI